MKFIFACILSFVFKLGSIPPMNSLTVMITNIKKTEGEIAVALYDSEKKFMKVSYQLKLKKAVAGAIEITFENIPNGQYALSVIHDQNENKQLDKNLFGIPTEGFGFSNDAMGKFGPPSFQRAKVDLNDSKVISITLKYL